MNKIQVGCLVLCLMQAGVLSASIESDLESFFHGLGLQNNVTAPGAFQDQSAGYYTGGSLMARSTVRNAQLGSVQMPGYRAGCGGIDVWMGGISHIKSQEFANVLEAVTSDIPGYAFLLSMEAVSPLIYNIINELNAMATKVNHFNMNSCEMAATTLGGFWPKSDAATKHLCQAMGTNLNEFSDWSAARHGCGAKGDREAVLAKRQTDSRYKDMLVGEFNLSWEALKRNSFLSSDKALAELFMTMVGSIISQKEGESFKPRPLKGYAHEDSLLKSLLHGGETTIYKCDSVEKCLNPTLGKRIILESSALLRKVHTILDDLVNAIYEDKAITTAQQHFLNSVRLPVYKMLNVSTAYRLGAAPLNVHEYAELIALDILYQYAFEVMDLVQANVFELKLVQVDKATISEFLNYLGVVRERLSTRRAHAFHQMDLLLSFVESVQLIEKQLHVMLGNVANEHNWY